MSAAADPCGPNEQETICLFHFSRLHSTTSSVRGQCGQRWWSATKSVRPRSDISRRKGIVQRYLLNIVASSTHVFRLRSQCSQDGHIKLPQQKLKLTVVEHGIPYAKPRAIKSTKTHKLRIHKNQMVKNSIALSDKKVKKTRKQIIIELRTYLTLKPAHHTEPTDTQTKKKHRISYLLI